MFEFNITGVPTLKMLPLEEISRNTFYLTADQRCVVYREPRDDSYIVFDLKDNGITVFCEGGDINDLLDNYSGASMVFPAGTVLVSLSLSINGGVKK